MKKLKNGASAQLCQWTGTVHISMRCMNKTLEKWSALKSATLALSDASHVTAICFVSASPSPPPKKNPTSLHVIQCTESLPDQFTSTKAPTKENPESYIITFRAVRLTRCKKLHIFWHMSQNIHGLSERTKSPAALARCGSLHRQRRWSQLMLAITTVILSSGTFPGGEEGGRRHVWRHTWRRVGWGRGCM